MRTARSPGSQAVVDARALAQALATASSVEDGLRSYERTPLPPMNQLILKNRELGSSIIMDMAEARAPDGFDNIENVIPHAELESISLSFKRAAGFDPKSLNERPSFSVPRA